MIVPSISRRASAAATLRLALLAVVALTGVSSCGGAPTYNWKAENALGYRIGPGDKMRVSYWNHKDLDTEVTVRPDGAFSMPLINDVQASGRSADEIAADVGARLHKLYKDDGPVTVLMGLSIAGGFTRFANPDRIVVVRRDSRGERRIPFDYGAVVDHGDLQQNLVLQLGDTVIVP